MQKFGISDRLFASRTAKPACRPAQFPTAQWQKFGANFTILGFQRADDGPETAVSIEKRFFLGLYSTIAEIGSKFYHFGPPKGRGQKRPVSIEKRFLLGLQHISRNSV